MFFWGYSSFSILSLAFWTKKRTNSKQVPETVHPKAQTQSWSSGMIFWLAKWALKATMAPPRAAPNTPQAIKTSSACLATWHSCTYLARAGRIAMEANRGNSQIRESKRSGVWWWIINAVTQMFSMAKPTCGTLYMHWWGAQRTEATSCTYWSMGLGAILFSSKCITIYHNAL